MIKKPEKVRGISSNSGALYRSITTRRISHFATHVRFIKIANTRLLFVKFRVTGLYMSCSKRYKLYYY